MTTATRTGLDRIVNLDRYPVDRPDTPRGRLLVDFCRASLAFEGACQLPDFLLPDTVRQLVAEAGSARSQGHRTDDAHNVYFEPPPAEVGADDLLAPAQHSSKTAVAWDLLDPDSPLRTLHESDHVTSFLRTVLGTTELYRYADPLGAASLMIFDEGDELGWHFDRAPFAVTVMLQPSLRGGAYEYHHHLRTDADGNDDGVRRALRDELPGRITLPNEPGTLSLFHGRYSLHRVTPVGGRSARINAVLAYSSRPGDTMNPLTQELFYGRSVGGAGQRASRI